MKHRARTLDLPDSLEIRIDGQPVRIGVRRSTRARRYTLRMVPTTGEPLLVIPVRGNLERGRDFAQSQAGWLRERLRTVPGPIPFVDGAEIPLRGKPHVLRHSGGLRGTIETRGRDSETGLSAIHVPGEEEHFARRLTDWLKKQARADLERRCWRMRASCGSGPSASRSATRARAGGRVRPAARCRFPGG